jgi:3-methyladenine DNA glycosylase AlkD
VTKTKEIIALLKSQANPASVAGMARFGINPRKTLGVSIPVLRKIAREHRRDHALAIELWETGIHEARILAAFVDDPEQVAEAQMEGWVSALDSWDVCDQLCGSLFDKTPFAWRKIFEWTERPEEFVRRAGFVLMAALAVHDKKIPDAQFQECFALIVRASGDERNFVKKAVNWALRQIGKRNARLNRKAIKIAEQLIVHDSKSARWVGRDALRELNSDKIHKKLFRNGQT